MKPFRFALLGCGAVSEGFYAPALEYLEAEGTAVLAGAFDPDAMRAAKLCSRFPNATAHPDESFLNAAAFDAVIVASPVSSHEAHAFRALEAGIAVLCEKPLAATVAAGERLMAASHRHNRLLAVGLLRRFYANVQFTRQLIENKTLGEVKSFSIQEGGPFSWPARSDFLFRKETAGGGILIDIGVHVLDLIVHWFGEPQQLSYADDAMGGLEANCRMALSYPGFQGSIHLSRDWKTTNSYVIEFERGTLRLHAGNAEQVEIEAKGTKFTLEGPLKMQLGTNPKIAVFSATTFQQAFLAQLQDLIVAIRTGGKPTVPGEEGIRSLRLIEQCYHERKMMEMPWLTPEERKAGQILATGAGV